MHQMLQQRLRREIILRHTILQWHSSPKLFLYGVIRLKFKTSCRQPFYATHAKIGFFIKHVTAASAADMWKEEMKKGVGYFSETDHNSIRLWFRIMIVEQWLSGLLLMCVNHSTEQESVII